MLNMCVYARVVYRNMLHNTTCMYICIYVLQCTKWAYTTLYHVMTCIVMLSNVALCNRVLHEISLRGYGDVADLAL